MTAAAFSATTNLVVGIGELVVSNRPEHMIVTHALGSCLGVTAHDPVARVGGMVHVMLPLTPSDHEDATLRPAKYVETGVAMLFRELYALGGRKERILLCVAGGARTTGAIGAEIFEIGRRNAVALKKVLWQNGVLARGSDLGGTHSRSLTLRIDDGTVTVAGNGMRRSLGGAPCP
jgi:chemotaxis protein CheD